MAQFIVNTTLLVAVLALLIVWAVTSRRRRHRGRRQRAAERRVILAALTNVAAPEQSAHDDSARGSTAHASAWLEDSTPVPAAPLDTESVTALLELLDDRRPSRQGLLAGLITIPRSVWSAGSRAGHNVGVRTMSAAPQPEPNNDIYRATDQDQAARAIGEITGATHVHGTSADRCPQIDAID